MSFIKCGLCREVPELPIAAKAVACMMATVHRTASRTLVEANLESGRIPPFCFFVVLVFVLLLLLFFASTISDA